MNEQLLEERLERLAAAIPGGEELRDVFDVFIRTASDDTLVRINSVRFGQQYGFPTAAVVELFLHARKLGLLTAPAAVRSSSVWRRSPPPRPITSARCAAPIATPI